MEEETGARKESRAVGGMGPGTKVMKGKSMHKDVQEIHKETHMRLVEGREMLSFSEREFYLLPMLMVSLCVILLSACCVSV